MWEPLVLGMDSALAFLCVVWEWAVALFASGVYTVDLSESITLPVPSWTFAGGVQREIICVRE